MTATANIPTSVTTWIAELPNREGWGGWDHVGHSVLEGVQNWSVQGDESTAIGVWGIVTDPDPAGDEAPTVEWAIYVGDCREPQMSGYETAEDAMRAAEAHFSGMFD